MFSFHISFNLVLVTVHVNDFMQADVSRFPLILYPISLDLLDMLSLKVHVMVIASADTQLKDKLTSLDASSPYDPILKLGALGSLDTSLVADPTCSTQCARASELQPRLTLKIKMECDGICTRVFAVEKLISVRYVIGDRDSYRCETRLNLEEYDRCPNCIDVS